MGGGGAAGGRLWQPPTGLPLPWAGSLPLCLCLLLPVSHPWQHSDGEQLMEGNTFHSNKACPSSPPSVNPTQSAHTPLKRTVVVSGGKQMPNIRCRLHSVQRTYAVFSNHRMTESMACTLQVLQNSRFPWHKAWALRQLAQTLAYMEKRSSPSVPWIHSCKESSVWLLTVFNLGHEGFIIKSATCVKENANWTVHSSSPIISLCEFLYSC